MQPLLLVALVALGLALLNATASAQGASSQGSVQLYSDSDCTKPSGTTIMLAVNTCLPSIQVAGIAAVSFPSCASGKPLLYISDYDQCMAPSVSQSVSSGNINDCLYFITGSYIGSAAFVCVGDVTTISDSQPAAATETTPEYTTTSTPTISTTTSAPQPSSGQGAGGSSGLPLSDKIALGLGIGFGLPTLIVGFLAWYYNYLDRQEQLVRPRLRLVPHDGPPPPYELHVRY
jgi:hypothetical protein